MSCRIKTAIATPVALMEAIGEVEVWGEAIPLSHIRLLHQISTLHVSTLLATTCYIGD